MKVLCSLLVLLLLRDAMGAVVRKPPGFSKPMYSDSYLPAAMQVIFHAVEQLKQLDCEEASASSIIPESSSHASQTEQSQEINVQGTMSTVSSSSKPSDGMQDEKGSSGSDKLSYDSSKEMEASTESNGTNRDESQLTEVSSVPSETSSGNHQELPEMNEETPETNYATPEANYELPEDVHGAQETNHEVPEENQEEEAPSTVITNIKISDESDSSIVLTTPKQETISQAESHKKKEPTIDSIVEEIYEIVKPTPSIVDVEETETSEESKSASGISIEKMESLEEEEDETRFTLLGEKVAQVPRPSLSGYLRRAKVPPRASLQQLANLYDALSKDARKQGYGKYTGYSDEVLMTLETSAEGGIGPQMKKILQKIQERNELTREDAKMRISETLRDLDNPSSSLNKDLRRLLPLRYSS